MIRWYRFKNFYSFRDTTTVSFELDRKAPRNDLSFDSLEGARLNYIMAVLGPNASGKTQLLKPLAFLQWLVCRSFTVPAEGEALPFSPHFFADEGESTEIEVEFEADGRVFRYFVAVNPDHILEESLKERGTRSFKTLFRRQRTEHGHEDGEHFSLRGFDLSLNQARKVRDRVSLISWAHQHDVHLATLVNSAFGRMRTNIASFGKVDRTAMDIFDAAHFFQKNERLFDRARSIIRNLDLGISDIELIEQEVLVEGKPHKFTSPFAVHEHADNQTIKLPMSLESTGTCVAFQLLQALLPVLARGGLAVIDEMEGDLHPQMLDVILDLFLNPDTNPNKAQLLFSCHSPAVFKRLEKSQIILVEKNDSLSSEAWRLDEIKGVRRDDNLLAKYYAGAYGALPRV